MLLVLAALVVLAIVFSSAKASLQADSGAIAKIGMPLGGGTVKSITVTGGKEQKVVPVRLDHGLIVATSPVPANENLRIDVVVKRPGWIAWLAGKTQHLTLRIHTPAASLVSHYITLGHNQPLVFHFKTPVQAIAYGPSKHDLVRHVLAKPTTTVTIPHSGSAGTIYAAAQIHPWETSDAAAVSYFPGGGSASAVANPAPGASIKVDTPITISFSKPVSKVLGSHMPILSPATPGSWHTTSSHAIEFQPSGYGYGLGAHVTVTLPNGVRLVGGQAGTAESGNWVVPGGSVVRAQQLLAQLGYLPVTFHYKGAHVATNPTAQENAAVNPPAGSFSWRYPNTPGQLVAQWSPTHATVITQGAIMMFENDHDMDADGQLGPAVWKALITAADAHQTSSFGYTFVMVHEAGSGESTTLWHSGKTLVTTPANTGSAAAGGTATGTYPVFEHLQSTTMTGVNPDGSHYSDPGILWVSYFNGGDALHEYPRASYGFPQSDGCVEMPMDAAQAIWPYTPIGALVDVST